MNGLSSTRGTLLSAGPLVVDCGVLTDPSGGSSGPLRPQPAIATPAAINTPNIHLNRVCIINSAIRIEILSAL